MPEMFGDFHFLRPWAFLAVLPLLAILWFWRNKQGSASTWKNYCDEKFLSHLAMGENESSSRPWHIWLVALVSILALLSLAGPVWQKLPQPVFKSEQARVFVLDLSQSMMATDIAPSRLARAKHKLLDMLAQSKEGQSALIVFANLPYVVSPLTDDAQTIAASVPTLSTDLMPAQGSSVDLAIAKAVQLLKQSNFSEGHIVLISDDSGKNTDAISQQVVDGGYRLSVLAVGTEQGAPVPAANGELLKDSHGAIVIPKLNVSSLRRLSEQSNGLFSTISIDDSDINRLLSEPIIGEVHLDEKDAKRQTDLWNEEGPWLLLALLPLVAIGFRKGWLASFALIFTVFPPQPSYAFEWPDLWESRNQQAYEFMKDKKPKQAAETFEDERWKGAAYYRAGDYENAVKTLNESESIDDQYNKANSLAQLGKLDEAISEYEKVIKRNPQHADAQYNRDLLKKFLEQQEQQSGEGQDKQDNQDQQQEQQQAQDSQNGQGEQQTAKDSQSADNKEQSAQSGSEEKQSDQADSQQAQNKENEESEGQDQRALSNEKKEAEKDNQGKQPADSQIVQREYKEDQQAMEQWLRRIPDDPGGLLRQKFLLQHRLQEAQGSSDKPW